VTALDLARALGHEELVAVREPASGLTAVVAIHDTTLGPAVGGTRMRAYPSLDAAAVDALRLSRAMTYKAALAEVPRGGGKAVIVGDPARDKTRALLAEYARLLDRFGGRFHSGPDMGFDLRDVAVVARLTRYMTLVPAGAGVDAADLTAMGVFESIRTAARALGRDLAGLGVALQGLGQVGFRLARLLGGAGARLTVSDLDAGRVERAAAETGASVVAPEAIYDVETDVFSPNAGGGVLDGGTIPRLRCRAVVGAANEQLADPEDGDRLHGRGILYAPDYVVNAGGLLSLLFEIGETDEAGVVARVRGIGARLGEIFDRARSEGVAPHRVADRIAEERLAAARAARRPLAEEGSE
jgi:leucine dehydrogenase